MKEAFDIDKAKGYCAKRNIEFVSAYKNGHDTLIEFICHEHGKQTTTWSKLKSSSKNICKACSGKSITTNTLIERIKNISPNIEILGEYQGCENHILCRCRLCGNEWETSPRSLSQGSSCPECAKKSRSNMRKRNAEDVLSDIVKMHPYFVLLGDYVDTQTDVSWKCSICGSIWKSTPSNLLSGNTHCYTCSKKRVRKNALLPNDEFEKRLNSVLPHIKPLDKFDGYYAKIRCVCSIHNEEFMSTPHSLLDGKCGCTKCYETHGERKMRIILSSLGICIKQQYVFSDCKSECALKFDGYCKEYNIAFEFNGEQHYRVVDFSGNDIERAKEQYDKLRMRDNIKRVFCTYHNIPLIEIPYWHYEDMEAFLRKELTWVTKTHPQMREQSITS